MSCQGRPLAPANYRIPAQYQATAKPSANPATVTVSPLEPSATGVPSGSGSLVRPFWFSIARCAAEPKGFVGSKLSTNFRIGSGKANSAIPIITITAAMTLGANSSLPSLALTEFRSIAHNLYRPVPDGGRMMSGFRPFGLRTSLGGRVLSGVAGG